MEPLTDSLRNPGRLAALADTGLPDSTAEESFDRLTRMVTRLLGVPVALVSLVDDNRQFFKSHRNKQDRARVAMIWHERGGPPGRLARQQGFRLDLDRAVDRQAIWRHRGFRI